MQRELLILRHGKSDWGSDAVDDFDRPLSRRGRKAVKRMAFRLREQNLLPRQILSSPAERARQTTLRLCRHADIPESRVVWDQAIYAADLGALLDVLTKAPGGHSRVMIVGHNPGLEKLVAYLAGEPIEAPAGSPALPTAALVRMTMPGHWKRLASGCAQLVSIDRPRDLE
ncbi:MAG: histidine phosphatase family protein [Gammaproteobacteria bacterium]|nr:MAG: histidine phosphatase family protein [Gammaproteobacteria bacterium]